MESTNRSLASGNALKLVTGIPKVRIQIVYICVGFIHGSNYLATGNHCFNFGL